MKTRIYSNDQNNIFPLYSYTSDVDCLQNAVHRPEGYGIHQIFLVSKGTGVLSTCGKTYYLEEGDLFYISAGTEHSYAPTDKNFSTTYISFFGEGFNKIKEYYKLSNYGIYKRKNTGEFKLAVHNLYDKLDEVHETPILCSLTYVAVITFFEEAFKKQISPIEEVYYYLESNYHKNISLEDILSFYPFSKAKLCRSFKEQYHVTIFEKLLSVRLHHAHHMLESNNHLSLKTISSSCGFNDTSYFCKMYKKTFNKSPKSKNNPNA